MLLTRDEVAALVGFHSETIKRASHSGELPAYYFGGRTVRYRRGDVERWVEGFRYQKSPMPEKRPRISRAAV
jgi:excisionase family DNA binding protein